MQTSAPKLGRMQLQIMQYLWHVGEATVRQVMDELAQSSPVARSTVQTVLRKMEAKHLIAHRDDNGVFTYRPLLAEADATTSAADDLLDRVFRGSLYDLVAHLLQPERIDPEEMRRLGELIERKRAESAVQHAHKETADA